MTHVESLEAQALAAAVFIGAFGWTTVRLSLLIMVYQRYLALREQRGVPGKPVPFGTLALPPLLVALALCVPAAVVFVIVRVTGALPSGPMWAAVLLWPVIAAVGFVFARRSPFAKLRAALGRAASAKEDGRHEMLERALAEDPGDLTAP